MLEVRILRSIEISRALLIALAIAAMALAGCTVKLVSNYDEKTDKAVSELQKEVESFFVTMEEQQGTPACAYENHKSFYDETAVELSAIEVRAKALEKNEITVEQVNLLQDSFNNLEQLHQKECLSSNQIESLRSSFNSSITAILRLELAKKRGDQ